MAYATKLDYLKSVYYNEAEYLVNKTAQLNAVEQDGDVWTVALTKQAIQRAGMTVWEHFDRHGAFERAADGGYGIDPSKYFDLDKYYTEKISQCLRDGGITYTKQTIVNTFESAALNPINHFALWGYTEDLAPRQNMAAKSYSNLDLARPTDAKYSALMKLPAGEGLLDWNKEGFVEGTNTLTFSYAQNLNAVHPGYSADIQKFEVMNANQKAGVQSALDHLHDVTGINFVYTSNASAADLTFMSAWYQPGGTGLLGVMLPAWTSDYSDNKAYIAISPSATSSYHSSNNFKSWAKGTEAYSTLVHELGHALGLSHPNNNGNHASYTAMQTIMSYRDPAEQWYKATDSDSYYSPLDLMTLNYIYGSDGLGGKEGLVYKDATASATSSSIWQIAPGGIPSICDSYSLNLDETLLASAEASTPMLDTGSYMAAKLQQMQVETPEYTQAMLVEAFASAGVDATTHYVAYGQYEGISLVGVERDADFVYVAEYSA